MDFKEECILHNDAINRLRRCGVDTSNNVSIIAALENEINDYREMIVSLRQKINSISGFSTVITEFTKEETSDGGSVILENNLDYTDVVGVLMKNGYSVKLEQLDENKLVIEFWKE